MSIHVTVENAQEHIGKYMFGYIDDIKEKYWYILVGVEDGKLRMSSGVYQNTVILADRAMIYVECKACRGKGENCKECEGHGHER